MTPEVIAFQKSIEAYDNFCRLSMHIGRNPSPFAQAMSTDSLRKIFEDMYMEGYNACKKELEKPNQ